MPPRSTTTQPVEAAKRRHLKYSRAALALKCTPLRTALASIVSNARRIARFGRQFLLVWALRLKTDE
eukprot:5600639-Lingulodinium_polyedra.AAC.1